MKCEFCPLRLHPEWKFCPACGHEVVISEDTRLDSYGVAYLPAAFEEKAYRHGRAVAENSEFSQTFLRFILSVVADPTQLVHFRAQIVHEVTRLSGSKLDVPIVQVQWCALSLVSERYFDEKARGYDWTNEEEEELKTGWFNLMGLAFLPSSTTRRLDIKVLKAWVKRFVDLHKRSTGPLPTCGPCTSKCLYQLEVSKVTESAKVKSDFYATINRPDSTTSESAAHFSQLLATRLQGKGDIDLSYCLSVHLVAGLEQPVPVTTTLSTDAQAVLAHKIRTSLKRLDDEAARPGETTLGAGDIRSQVLEVVVRQALAGAPWQMICAAPMKAQNITVEEVEAEVKRRKALL